MNEKNILKIFGDNIKILRMVHKLSQDDLVEKTGISKPYISGIENGKNQISLTYALKIAKVFNKTLDEMITEIKL